MAGGSEARRGHGVFPLARMASQIGFGPDRASRIDALKENRVPVIRGSRRSVSLGFKGSWRGQGKGLAGLVSYEHHREAQDHGITVAWRDKQASTAKRQDNTRPI